VKSVLAWVLDCAQTVLRLLPWPTETGLRVLGNPDESSPVLVTGNYDLTVRRVERAMRGRDSWLVVAPSGGINVWCAASGGHLTTHQIVTALKTSGVAERVNHRRAILPQLAATGVLALDVFRRCRWNVRFGPTRAEDLPRYLDRGGEKDDAMRAVRFGARERLEMAAVWGVPAGLLFAGVAWGLRPAWSLPLLILATGAAALCFLVYDRLPEPRRLLFATGLVAAPALAVLVAGGGVSGEVPAVV